MQTLVWRGLVGFLLIVPDQFLIFVFFTAYAATTRDKDYVKMEGLKQLVSDREHRQEIVANGLGSYLTCREFATQSRSARL